MAEQSMEGSYYELRQGGPETVFDRFLHSANVSSRAHYSTYFYINLFLHLLFCCSLKRPEGMPGASNVYYPEC